RHVVDCEYVVSCHIDVALGQILGAEQRYGHDAGFQQAASRPLPIGVSRGRSFRQRVTGAGQRSAKAQPSPRAPGAGTIPGIAGNLTPGLFRAGIVSTSARVSRCFGDASTVLTGPWSTMRPAYMM